MCTVGKKRRVVENQQGILCAHLGTPRGVDMSDLCRTKMQEAIRKMQDRLFNKGRKYNELIQVWT